MQEAEVGGRTIMLPSCHDGDVEWIASQLYAMKTRNFEAGPHINEVQRYAMMRNYDASYCDGIDCSVVRRAANTALRESIESYKNMINGVTSPPNFA